MIIDKIIYNAIKTVSSTLFAKVIENDIVDSTLTKRKYIKGRKVFWKSKYAPFKLEEYADVHIKSFSFQRTLQVLNLKGEEKILDFGASTCWASYIFSKIGCNTIAVDFDMDNAIGLLAGKKLIEDTRIYFELVACDCEQIPFRNECFDIAFGSQVLHHAEDLNKMVREVVRVTRSQGIVVVIGEAKRGIFQREEYLKKRHKAAHFDANEHFPSYFQYVSAFKKAGLVDITILPDINWDALKELIIQIDNPLKMSIYNIIYIFLSSILPNRLLDKFYLILTGVSITIIARKI